MVDLSPEPLVADQEPRYPPATLGLHTVNQPDQTQPNKTNSNGNLANSSQLVGDHGDQAPDTPGSPLVPNPEQGKTIPTKTTIIPGSSLSASGSSLSSFANPRTIPTPLKQHDKHDQTMPAVSDTSSGNILPSSKQSATIETSPNVSPPARPDPAHKTTDVWAFQAKQREAVKAAKAKAMQAYRPTMDELAMFLGKHRAGQATFDDTIPLLKHSPREIVGWLHMDIGMHIKTVDVTTAMTSLLFDNKRPEYTAAFQDVVKCEKDTQSRTLKWGFATTTSLNSLKGVPLQIQVNRDGTKLSFQMLEPHVLDGFYLDIPDGLRGQDEERLMFEAMSTLESRFLLGLYPTIHHSTGMAGSRYRLYFLGETAPASLCKDGRMVEELMFQGRSLRVYGKGWFFRDRKLHRIDLNRKHLDKPVEPLVKRSKTHGANPQPTTTAPSPPTWKTIRRSNGKRKANAETIPDTQPWASENMFEALAERVAVTTTTSTVAHGTTSVTNHLPRVEMHVGDAKIPSHGEFVHCTRARKGTTHRVEMSLDDILAELDALSQASKAESQLLSSHVKQACMSQRFNLASLVKDSRVDDIAQALEQYPVEFGTQLHQLFDKDQPTFNYLIRLRLMQRWLCATWGGTKSFATLYNSVFGNDVSMEHMKTVFSSASFSAHLHPLVVTLDSGDETASSRTDVELTLTLAEMLFATNAASIYKSDAAIVAITGDHSYAIATHKGHRGLASETLCALLMTTDVGSHIWDKLLELYTRANDDVSIQTLNTLSEGYDADGLDITMTTQPMFSLSGPCLIHGNLDDLWVNQLHC